MSHPNRKPESDYTTDSAEKHEEIAQIRNELMNYALTWWGKQWIKSMLEFGRPFRMQRGLKYAQEDRVENINVNAGQIFATVIGTMSPTPYRVKVTFEVINAEVWNRINSKIVDQAKFIIELLEHTLPEEFITIFSDCGAPLFPRPTRELDASCSCPDAQHTIPCKHIAATILYLARVIDLDPFIILKLRGRTKDQILQDLEAIRSCNNRPFVQSLTKLRNEISPSTFNFDVPNVSTKILTSDLYLGGKTPEIGFQFTAPGIKTETLDSFGDIINLTNPRTFHTTLQEIYRIVTNETYRTAIALQDKDEK